MKGLLVKDLRLMFTTKLVFVVIIMALLMSIFATDAPYILVLVGSLFSVSLVAMTCGNDEMNNVKAYLLTLPTSRRDYVIEKYLLTIVMMILSNVVMLTICLALAFKLGEPIDRLEIAINLGIGTIIGNVMAAAVLMLSIVFNSRIYRLVVAIIGGAVFLVAIGIKKFVITETFTMPQPILNAIEWMEQNPIETIGIFNIAAILLMVVSFVISLITINRKEF
ncbi:MAG: ABC-2 transporter permease [Lachnospiraceae bacterium]|nr:ABC-2 transporter permease [Lachnospiraceae bacterium]